MGKKLEESVDEVQKVLTEGCDIYGALHTIQLKLKAPKDMVNSFAHFNYRTAGAILEKVKPLLEMTGCTLTCSDMIEQIGDRFYVRCQVVLHHIASRSSAVVNGYAREGLTEKGKMDAQMTGSASTFAKKYALCNLFAIDDSAEDPDSQQMDRIASAIFALDNAKSQQEVDGIKQYFADVMSAPQVQQAGASARKRIGY